MASPPDAQLPASASLPGQPSAADEVLDALPWGVLELDAQGRIQRVNPQAAQWCGAPAEALLGQPLALAPLPPALQAELVRRLTAEAPAADADIPDLWLPHVQQWVSLRVAPAPAGHRYVFWEETTARHQAETSRQHSHELLQRTIDSSLDMVQVFEAVRGEQGQVIDFRWVLNNAAAERVYGDVIGQRLLELNPGVVETGIFDTFKQVLETGVPNQSERHYQHEQFDGWFYQSTVKLGDGVTTTTHDITQRKQAEQELHDTKELLRAVLDSSRYVVQAFRAVRDAAGKIIDFTWLLTNQTWRENYGGDMTGKSLLRENPGVVETGLFEKFVQVTETGAPIDHEQHYAHEQFAGWFHQTLVKLGDGFVMNTVDITARKQAEQELRESQQLVQTVFDVSLNPIAYHQAVRDATGRIIDFEFQLENREARKYAVQSRTGQRHSEAYPGILDTEVFRLYCEVVETGQPLDSEVQINLKGTARWFHLQAVRLDDGLVATAVDVTERRQAQEEILRLKDELARQATDRYQALLSATTQGFCLLQLLFDATGQHAVDFRYLELNEAFAQHSGLPAEAQGKRVSELVPNLEPHWLETYGRVALTGHPEHLEYPVAHLSRWYDAQAFRMGAPEDRQIGVLFSDITERKQQEERLRRAAEAETFRLQLADELGPLTDAVAVQEAVTRLARLHFGADRCYYCEIEGGQAIIRHDASAAGLPSVAGTYPLAAFALLRAVIDAGRAFIVRDVREDPSVDENLRQLCVQLQVISYLDVPVIKNGQPVGVLCLVQSQPREWTATEATLAAEVAERTWTAVERARAEEALRESEQRLRTLIANLPGAAVFIVDRELRYQLAEGEALRAIGYEPADFPGRQVREMALPSQWPSYQRNYTQALAGHPFEGEHTQGGRTFFTRGVPLTGPEGAVEAVLAVSYDITVRKQAEEALRVSEEKYRTLFETMDQGFGIGKVIPADDATGQPLDWQWLEVNPQFERLTGLPRTAVLSQTTRQLIPGLEEIWYERYAHVAATGETVSCELYSPVLSSWFDVYVFALGTPATRRVAVLFTNTTERRQAEAALRAAEERYREELEQQVAERTGELRESRDLLQTVFDTNLIAMSVLEAVRDDAGTIQDFRLRLVSRELARETSRDDLAGKLYAQEFPGIRDVGIFDLIVRAVETGEPQGMEYFYPHEGFDKWFACQFVKLGDGVVATNLDITERKTAEQELLKNLRLLEQAEAVAGLGSWDYELATGTMRWSDGMYHLFGLPLGSSVSPDHYLEAVLEEDRSRAEQLVHRLAAGESLEETLRLRVYGQVKTVRMKAVVLRDEADQPARVLGVDLDISQLQRLEADNLRLRLRQQQALFEAVQEAQEAERKRIAEALHNGIGQVLYATKLRLDQLHLPVLHTDPALVANRQEADRLLADAIRQTRALSHELVPMALEEFGLATALQDITRRLSSPQLRFACQVVLDAEAAPLSPSLQLALYRIAQELALNIVKHARGATQASLELETTPDWVLLRAEDNGPGFAANALASPGLGLRSIHDRVRLLGGAMETGTSGGAYVRIRIPLAHS